MSAIQYTVLSNNVENDATARKAKMIFLPAFCLLSLCNHKDSQQQSVSKLQICRVVQVTPHVWT